MARRRIENSEHELWLKATRDVKTSHAIATPVDRLPVEAVPAPTCSDFSEPRQILPIRTKSVFSGYPPLDGDTQRRLASSKVQPEARIDLHGMTEAAAHAALSGFIARCAREERRLVLVITGKGLLGQGVLKQNLPGWLEAPSMRRMIAGFRPALQADGGEGATYVMLRRKRNRMTTS